MYHTYKYTIYPATEFKQLKYGAPSSPQGKDTIPIHRDKLSTSLVRGFFMVWKDYYKQEILQQDK